MGEVMRKTSNDVDKYIARAPKEAQKKLREVRAAIREVAPDVVESISYGMPFYSFKGETGFQARLCYFGLLKGRIAFYSRPLFLEGHIDEAARYMTSKSALQFPIDKPIPIPLIKKLVSNGIRKHGTGQQTKQWPMKKRR